MDELISVICTVKNGENTIVKTIESVIEQTYTNWEIIIVDDGSTDGTISILNSYLIKDDRIKTFYSGGIGRGNALNKAIELSKGKYIANIDADDLMHPQRLEFQMKIISKYQSAFLVSSSSLLIYESELPNWKNINFENIDIEKINKSLLIRNQIDHSSVLMVKEKLFNMGKYNGKRKSQLDYELWLRSLLKDNDMYILKADLAAKRIHKNQSYENKKRLRYTFNSLILQLEYLIKSKRYIYLIPIPIISFILSQLPFRYRRMIVSRLFK